MHISQEVLSVLSQCHFSSNQLVLPAQLDRDLYLKTNKVLELAGGKWNRKAKAHIFQMDAETRIEQIILTASVDKPKDDFNYFPTPPAIIALMLQSVDIRPGDRVLEPSCGDGRIVLAAHALQPDISLTAVELEPVRAADLRNSPAFVSTGATLVETDYLSWEPGHKFDVIPMNPPFIRGSDIHHVNHAIEMLDEGGRLAAVMSAGVLFREMKLSKTFRNKISALHGVFTELDSGSFRESGTMVNTVLLTLTK
ncbi:methyltransferase [Cronobacter turicensis]